MICLSKSQNESTQRRTSLGVPAQPAILRRGYHQGHAPQRDLLHPNTNEYQNSYIKLIYLRSRMYSPLTGRYLTRDSWQGDYNRPLSLNRWNYVEGNPVNYTDPSGLCWVIEDSDKDGRWYPDSDYRCIKKHNKVPQEEGPVWKGPDSYGSVVDSLAFSNSGNIRNTSIISNTPEPLSSYANGLGDRLQETVNGVTTTFLMDLNSGLIQALSDGTHDYLYGNGRIAQVNGSNTEYFLGDALGCPRSAVVSEPRRVLTEGLHKQG
jgi:RHS repeat-associated protein